MSTEVCVQEQVDSSRGPKVLVLPTPMGLQTRFIYMFGVLRSTQLIFASMDGRGFVVNEMGSNQNPRNDVSLNRTGFSHECPVSFPRADTFKHPGHGFGYIFLTQNTSDAYVLV